MAIKQLNYVVLIENPKLRNLANIKLDLFDIIFLIVLLLVTKANYALCIALLVIKQLVFFVIAVENLKINIFKIRPSLKGIRPYIKYGLIPMITVILMEINYKVDVIMLERFNIAVSEIGVYSIGVMLAQKLWLVPDALKDILLSKLSKGKTSSEVAKISRISFFIMLIMITAMVAFGKTIISLMYGAEYNGAYGVTLIILAGALGMVFYKMIYSYNVVNGHKNVNLFILGISALFNVLVNALMIPKVGIIGAAIASLISYSLCGIAFLIYFCKTTKTNFLDMILIKKEDMNLVLSLIKK